MRLNIGLIRLSVALALVFTSTAGVASLTEGKEAYEKGQYANALQYFLPMAEEGDGAAQYYMGLLYEEGKGVRTDPVKARQWYEQAAKAGHSGAQFQLGRIYANGNGVAADGLKASRWYLLAAGQGNLDAQYSLGIMFKKGKGVPVDLVQAYLWFTRAAEQGLGNARVQKDYLKPRLSATELEEAQSILAEIDQMRAQSSQDAQLERERRAREAAQRKEEQKARQVAALQAQQEAEKQVAAEAARREAVRMAQEKAAVTAAQKAALLQAQKEDVAREEKRRAEEAQQRKQKQAANNEYDFLKEMFRTQFEADSLEAAERLRKFRSEETIIASKLISIEDIKVTEMNDGTSMVYVKYVMQKLQKGEGEPQLKESAKWFKVRKAAGGYEALGD